MNKFYTISINPLADFSKSTDAAKRNIIKQQKNPSKIQIPWYQLAKARIKKAINEKCDFSHIEEALEILKNKKNLNKRQSIDRQVSMEALERFIKLTVPKVIKDDRVVFHKTSEFGKSFNFNGVKITVAPEIIFSTIIKGKRHFGAIKLHISKNRPFDLEQQKIVSSGIYEFLKLNVSDKDIVIPEYCISLDVFGKGFHTINAKNSNSFSENVKYLEEIKQLWNVA